MKKITGIAVLCLALLGCSSEHSENRSLYLKTDMQSSVSGQNGVTAPAENFLKKENSRNFILYALRPLPGKKYSSELERKFTAVTMYIDLSPGTVSRTADISGEINYYDNERYENARLVGDSVKKIPIAKQTISLKLNKPVSIELPHHIHYSIMLTDSQL
ncbi:hypothetical protein [Pantoea sp.]|uniref:hypothetical protein n=1 Tax=Pantoea sp. TaxID=69393 RepID=UPI0031D15561